VGPKLFLDNFENMKRTCLRIFRSIKTPSANLHYSLTTISPINTYSFVFIKTFYPDGLSKSRVWIMRFYLKFLIGIVIISFLFTINYIAPLFITNKEILTLIEVASIAVGGLYFLLIITDGLRSVLEKKGSFSAIIDDIVRYIGYIIIFVIIDFSMFLVGFSLGEFLAGLSLGEVFVGSVFAGTFAGIVVSLASQPVLQNYFAGLFIMGSGFISTGDHVKIMSTRITYTPTLLPPYKFFSRDLIEQGIEGYVVDIGLLFSRILMDDGREIRVPNSILLGSSVINYSSKLSKEFIVNVRVEFPLNKLDLEKVEEQIIETLRGFEIVEGPYIYEQSDKDYVIISLKVKSDVENWMKVKSEVLRRLLILRKRIVES